MQEDTRIILFHKNKTSAKTVFWVRNNASICLFDDLPSSAEITTEGEENNVVLHPTSILLEVEKKLAISKGMLEVEPEFSAKLLSENQVITVYLARFTTLDPPQELAEQHQATFISITQARGFPSLELELLRLAYQNIMEG